MIKAIKAIWIEMTRPMTEEEIKQYNENMRNMPMGPWM